MKLKHIIFSTLLLLTPQSQALDVTEFESLPIQDGGRVKPFDTFAKENVQLITGTQKYEGKNATELVMAWLFFPDQWLNQKFIQIKHLQLKKDLDMPETQSYLSPQDVIKNTKLPNIFTELMHLQKEKKKLDNYYTAVNRLNNQLQSYQEIIAGRNIRLVPQALSPDWLPISDIKGELQQAFNNIANNYYAAIAKKDDTLFVNAVKEFAQATKLQAPQSYPQYSEIKMELIYNKYHPFRIAYIFYLLAIAAFTYSLSSTKKAPWYFALALCFAGTLVHIFGFALRCWIAGRPPVSNMYESVIWVALGCIVIGVIFELIYKRKYIGLAASAMATLCLIIGDAAPAVLDQSIRPLEPVLRSNYWLTIHVLTITLSYAAFALATGIGNIALSYYVRGVETQNKEKINALSLYVYRSIQVGVLLLTAGTILGGVWADYSWGRFWGWDPKETWALIADLFYLAVLHGRFSGWLKAFGTIAASVVAFSGVIMAWYGVNFVLGVGLHSYGFGGGGVGYVGSVLAVQLLYVAIAGYQHRKVLKKAKT
ncbi:MAG: cytochrome c biogenesis protein CcsA [Oligoflexia bacterium]|nr:cytochrome c biogenesis protein CcsA [Oligoflexia bacterium]